MGGLWGGLMVVGGRGEVLGGGTLDFCLRTCVPFVKDCKTERTSVCVVVDHGTGLAAISVFLFFLFFFFLSIY